MHVLLTFDIVIHPGMLIKLLKSDIGGNFYHLIKHMYTLNKLRVKVDNKLGQCFISHMGVRQGDVLRPSLFNLFINDLPNCLQNCPESVSLCTGRIDCLLYADDVIIFSNSANGLQDRLNALVSYCDTWCLNVNLKKLKF